jgi:hypothetical protein
MKNLLLLVFATSCVASAAFAQDADEVESTTSEETPAAVESPALEPGGPKTMSGMSILGNEETPKSLVIVPWKSSEMGDELSLSDTLDERARPVDKEVFLREVHFYRIRSGEQ